LSCRGFISDPSIEIATDGRRAFFTNGRLSIDLVLDDLNYCHRLRLRGRLQIDKCTLPLADLLLSKLQRVALRQTDWSDVLALLGTFDVGRKDGEQINVERVCGALKSDWGFCHTVCTNLALCAERLPELFDGRQPPNMLDHALHSAELLLAEVKATPKTLRWKLRSIIGPRIRWYQTVETVETIF
jgi:hypothetical protein